MAEEEPGKQPSLELPKLGFRRKRRTPPAEQAAAPDPTPTTPAIPHAGPAPGAPAAPTTPTPAPEPEPGVEVDQTRTIVVADVEPQPDPVLADEPDERPVRGPGGMLAALLTGLVVGLGIVGLTWASLRSCESIQGTSSCGGAGYPLLGLILAAMVVVGSLLLRFQHVADPTSTSFLGVGLAAVIALLVLVDRLLDREMIVVIPLVCAGTFALAHWVTRTFIEPAAD